MQADGRPCFEYYPGDAFDDAVTGVFGCQICLPVRALLRPQTCPVPGMLHRFAAFQALTMTAKAWKLALLVIRLVTTRIPSDAPSLPQY